MHYKNGREAKNGDRVVLISNGKITHGILYDAKPGNDFCNGRLALMQNSDPCPNLKECLHEDDLNAALTIGLGGQVSFDAAAKLSGLNDAQIAELKKPVED